MFFVVIIIIITLSEKIYTKYKEAFTMYCQNKKCFIKERRTPEKSHQFFFLLNLCHTNLTYPFSIIIFFYQQSDSVIIIIIISLQSLVVVVVHGLLFCLVFINIIEASSATAATNQLLNILKIIIQRCQQCLAKPLTKT